MGGNYSNLTVVLISEWILFQRGRPGSLPGTQNFVAVLARQLRLHAILLSPPLSLSLSLSRHPIPSNCESETNKLDAHWTECDVLPEQRRDRAWGVWGWMRDWRKSEEVDVCVCLLDTPIWPPGW